MSVMSREQTTHPAAPREEMTPEWVMCGGCRELIYGKRWLRNLKRCPECGHHDALTASERLRCLLDPSSLELLRFSVVPG